MKWITCEHVRINRVVIPWVVTRFIDPEAEFRLLPGPRAERPAA